MEGRSICNIPASFSVAKSLLLCCIMGTVLIIYFDRLSPNDIGPADNWNRSSTDNTSSPKIVARFYLNSLHNSTRQESNDVVDVLFIFTKAKSRNLREKLAVFLTSLFAHSSVPLHLHVVTDRDSAEVARQVLQDASARSSINILVDILHIQDVLQPIRDMVEYMRDHFSPPSGSHYSDPLYSLSLGLHRVFHRSMQVILIDIDTRIASDIALLRRHFSLFGDSALVGIAHEQQPTYRHGLHKYRQRYPNTKCGEPPDKGLPGFNSGVLLLDLGRIRSSTFYQELLSKQAVENITAKYSFKGNLGDQDYYTLLGCEYPELFYVLPCTWNRQLCKYWNEHGYSSVFNEYYNCKGQVHVYHGNCNSPIPGIR